MQRIGKHRAVTQIYRTTESERRVVAQSRLPVGYVHGVGSGLLAKIAAGRS